MWFVAGWFGVAAATDGFVEPDVRMVWVTGQTGTYFGWAVADVQDIDGDSISEVITGDPYVGGSAGSTVVLSGATGIERFHAGGAPGSYEGYGIASAGEQNGDGVDDIISGAPGIDAAIVYSGADFSIVRTLIGAAGELFGVSVSRAGDVDGDGLDEILVGAESADVAGIDAGRVYLLSGADGSVVWTRDGEAQGDLMGSGTAIFADVTSDDVPDVIVGARGTGGRVYVLSGIDGSTVRKFVEADTVQFGAAFVAAVGDMDGDGIPEIYAGDYAHGALGPGTGRAWVYSGATGERRFEFTGEAAGDGLGPGRYAGDVDGDGVPDVVIWSVLEQQRSAAGGRATVFSGADGFGLDGDQHNGCENLGFDTIGLGDVYGDGTVDLLVSAVSGTLGVYLIGTSPSETTGTTGDTGVPGTTDGGEPDPTGKTPDGGNPESNGCGCGNGPSRAPWVLVGLLAAGFRTRRARPAAELRVSLSPLPDTEQDA